MILLTSAAVPAPITAGAALGWTFFVRVWLRCMEMLKLAYGKSSDFKKKDFCTSHDFLYETIHPVPGTGAAAPRAGTAMATSQGQEVSAGSIGGANFPAKAKELLRFPIAGGSSSGSGTGPTRDQMLSTLRDIGDWIVHARVGTNNISRVDARHQSYIFVNGNLARVLLAAARITANASYLAEGLSWCDTFEAERRHAVTSTEPERGATCWAGLFSHGTYFLSTEDLATLIKYMLT